MSGCWPVSYHLLPHLQVLKGMMNEHKAAAALQPPVHIRAPKRPHSAITGVPVLRDFNNPPA